MILFKSRRERELIIAVTMIRMHCLSEHRAGKTVCHSCNQLVLYTTQRLNRCKFGDGKPVCKDCEVHCYSPEKREEIRKIMRWAGPKMLYRHPLYALIHLLDSLGNIKITHKN